MEEKCTEYQKPLCLAFVDYEKASDSIESKAILISLEKQRIDKGYIDTLAEIQSSHQLLQCCTERAMKFRCDGDTLSPKLFTVTKTLKSSNLIIMNSQ